jgi:subtilisin-like proprotein convertase family protein
MNSARISFMLLALQCFCIGNFSKAQYGYSPSIDSLVLQVTDSSLSLLDRQLSGDTTVIINGITDSIKTRHSNYADNSKAAQFILEKFQSYGLDAYLHQYDDNGQNVVATKPGTVFPNQQFIITAHYDAMPNGPLAPGADDNASGTSAIIEAARVMGPMPFPYTVKFIAFDEEEQGLIGSQYYADWAYANGHQILGVINLDMLTWDGNNDFACHVSTNTPSLPLVAAHIDNLKLYQPVLSPRLITIGSSDHYRFWGKGYPALLQIEEYQYDFNPYYHTVNDHFGNVNRPYFLAMARGAIASFINMASNYKMELAHQPLANEPNENPRIAKLVITGPNPADTGVSIPRLYYRLDDEPFAYTSPFSASGDTLLFELPGFPLGSKVSYYFAAQDQGGHFSVTLPEFGKGVDPPGTVAPPILYSYFNLKDTLVSACATGLPLSIPPNSTVTRAIGTGFGGRILDLNVKASLTHTNAKDISLYLISPAGRQLKLSTRNGYNLDHYTNTVFDDEASLMINQALPPYTGSFRPEQPLAIFRDTTTYGNWTLKIVNTGGVTGTLTSYCLYFNYSGDCRYVDASRPFSGDGYSWETALTSIEEASASNPTPGSIIFIKPGSYQDDLVITSNGEETVPLTTGVAITDTNRIQFPEGTDLSGLDVDSYPEQYYTYVYNSLTYNNGIFIVDSVNDGSDYVTVKGARFTNESGTAGDSSKLSVAIGRPVIYRKYTDDPDNERVILDSVAGQALPPALYIGIPIGDGSSEAFPANFNIIDGIDFTGYETNKGIHIQGSSFNVVCNGRIFENGGTGVYINGNGEHPACFNVIKGNEIFNSPEEGIRIGSGQLPSYNNQAHYNHLLGNDIHLTDTGDFAQMDYGIHISHYNHHTLVEKNVIHDFSMESSGKGVLEIHSHADHTVVNGNIFKNISKISSGANACIHIHDSLTGLRIFNNIIYDSSLTDDDVYALWADGTGHSECSFDHNTIFNMDRAYLLEDHSGAPGFMIRNNIVAFNETCFTHLGNSGNYFLSHNQYFTDPELYGGSPYSGEPGRQIGQVDFMDCINGDFRLKISNPGVVCSAVPLSSEISIDFNGNPRDGISPDIGAFELENKLIWLGSEGNDWHSPSNWSSNSTPNAFSNVVIGANDNEPVIQGANAVSRGLLLKPGANLIIFGENQLIIEN